MTTLGNKIDGLFALREQKRKLEEKVKVVQTQMIEIEDELMVQMDAEGVAKSTGRKASVAISTTLKPNVENWDSFYAFIHKNKRYDLLERRPAVLSCRELFETKGKIPGVQPVTLRKINLRSL